MNTQTGKSVGIALLLAAGLLAVLFAFGVFSPGGAQAGVKGSPATEVELSTYKPGAENVMLTATFQVNDEVDGTTFSGTGTDNIVIALPSVMTDLDFDNIRVLQGGVEVGGVMVKALASGDDITAGTAITITTPNAMDQRTGGAAESIVREKDTDNGNVLANTDITLIVTGLGIPLTADTGEFTVYQAPQTAAPSAGAAGHVAITFAASVTSASASLNKRMADDEDVTLTLSFQTDTHSTDAANNPVTIVLPKGYDLATDDGIPTGETAPANAVIAVDAGYMNASDTDSKISVSPSSVVVTTTTTDNPGNTPDPIEEAETLTVSGFGTATSNPRITITISGLTNPDGTMPHEIGFRQAGTEAQKKATVYVTKDSDVQLTDSTGDRGIELSDMEARAEEVSLEFNFTPFVEGDADPPIVIELNDEFSFPDTDSIWWRTYQMVDGKIEIVQSRIEYVKDDLNDISVTLEETTDATKRSTASTDNGNIFVEFRDLTNPGLVGQDIPLVTVTQGNYEPTTVKGLLTGVQVSTTTAGAAVRVKISTAAANNIPAGEDIIVDLPGFILPDSIAREQVLFNGGRANVGTTPQSFIGIPASVSVGTNAVTLALPIAYPDGTSVPMGVHEGDIYTITFKLGAGLKNQTVKRGDRAIGASDAPITNTNLDVTSKVNSHAVSRGELVTFSVIGLKSGSATIYLRQGDCIDVDTSAACLDADGNALEDDDFRIGGGLQEGGKVEVERRVTSTLFQANANNGGPTELNADGDTLIGTNVIYSVDGTGVLSDAHGRVTILPTVEAAPESIKQGGLLELELSDWYYGSVTAVAVAGVPITHEWTGGRAVPFTDQPVGGDGEAEFIVVMPPGVRLGEQQLQLTGSTTDRQGSVSADALDSYTTFITVDPLDLEVSPTNDAGEPEVVINQEFTITGKGFNTNQGACILSVKFGDVVLDETTAGINVDCGGGGDILRPDTAGNFSATFRLEPDFGGVSDLKIGEYRVEVKDNEERVGLIDVIIPEPIVEVDPEESRRGTTVTVVGSKFPASPELAVELRYGLAGNEKTIGAATPDSGGNFRATFTVPTTAVIGEDHVLLAAPIEEAFSDFEGKGTHRLPEQLVVVNPSRVAAGGRMNLEGHNMPLFTLVNVDISGIRVSGEGFETDGIGHFTKTNILVPQLQPGIHTITAHVQTQGGVVQVRTSVEVADIVTRPTPEVFEDLIEAGILTVVWKYDNASGTWASYDPAAPDEVNDLDLVSTDDIVWVQTTADYDFQGRSYLAGWNLYSLE